MQLCQIVSKLKSTIVSRTNSASHFEFKLRERAPWDGDKNLRGARTKRGMKVEKGLRLK